MNAREASLAAALAARPREGQSAEDALRERLPSVAERDRALAREILGGSLRRRASLDAVIDLLVGARALTAPVREILRQGLYQLLFLDRVPDHAATHDAVELAKTHAPRAAGLINGVLRSAIRARRIASARHPRALVIDAEHGVGVEGLAVPDPELDLAGNLALRHSYPRPLVERWLARHGPERCERLLLAGNQAPPTVLRVNLRRISREMALARLDEAGMNASPGAWPTTIILERPGDVTRLPGFAEGELSVQGEAAQRAAFLLDPREAVVIVDLCAAPGGKATALLELAPDAATLIAVDTNEQRLARVAQSCARLGLPQPTLAVGDARVFALPPGLHADRVLVDAPCSNTGVLARRLEARWRFDPAALAKLSTTGVELLRHALSLLAPAGRLLYSTCSLEPEENEAVVDQVLAGTSGFRLVAQEHFLPDEHRGDGAYMALITRL